MSRLRFSIAAAVAALGLALFAEVAEGGGRIGKLGSCANSYEFFAHGTGSVKDFRAALLCLINEARATQKLPALKRSARLERVAQAQSNTFARTGSASHGSSLSDIAARFVKVGYHPAAYDEAFSPPRADGEWVDGQSRSALRRACVVRADLDADASRRARECGQWERHDTCGRHEDGHLHLSAGRPNRGARCGKPERVA